MTGPMPWNSGSASDEYFRQLAAFNSQRDQFLYSLQQGGQPQSWVGTVPIGQAQKPDPAQWNDDDLLGAAHFWGIPADVAQHMPKHVLQAQVEMLRQGARPDEDTFANRLAAMASVPLMSLVGGAEAISHLAQSIPIVGPALKRVEKVKQIDTYIRSLEEGLRVITPENFQPVLTGANMVGNLAATWYPSAAAWGVAGRGTAWVGNPIVRGAVQGGASAWMLEGGGDHSGMAVAVGAPLGAAGVALAPAIEAMANKVSKRFLTPAMFEGEGPSMPIMRMNQASDYTKIANAAAQGDENAAAIMQELQRTGHMKTPTPPYLRNWDESTMGPKPSFAESQTWQDNAAATLLNHRPTALGPQQAESLASQMNKVEMIVNSPELPRVAMQTAADDISVAEAAMVSNPGGTNVIEGIADPGQFVQGRVVGDAWRPAQSAQHWWDRMGPEHRPNVLPEVSAEADFASLDKFSQRKVENTFEEITAHNAAANQPMKIRPNILGMMNEGAESFSGTPPVAPHMSFAQRNGRLSAILSDEPITAKMVSSFEKHGMYPGQNVATASGIQVRIHSISDDGIATVHSVYGDGVFHYPVKQIAPFTASPGSIEVPHLWEQFQQYADQQVIASQLAMGQQPSGAQFETMLTAEMPQYMDDFLDMVGATTTGSRARVKQYFSEQWVKSFYKHAPQEIAENIAARESTQAIVNAHPDSPVGALDKIADTKGYIAIPNSQGGWNLRNMAPGMNGAVAPTEYSFESTEAANTWLLKVNRELPDISPAMPVPGELAGSLFRDPVQVPNTNETGPKALARSIADMTADNGGVPVVPDGEVRATGGDWGKLKNLWNRASAFTPMRHRFAQISGEVRKVAGDDFGLASDYDGLTNALVQHHNAMHEPVNTLADILAPINTKRLINGEWMRTWQIEDQAQRHAVATKLGWAADEIAAMDKFSQLISNVAQEDINPELRKYIGNLATKQSVPSLFDKTWDEPAAAGAINAWREHASTTNINLRELDPRVFGESFIRSVFWKRDMAPVFDPIHEKWGAYADMEGVSQVAGFMKNWMNVMKQGYTADDDLALDMIHLAAQKTLGASFTRQQAKELVNFGMNTTHAAFLGYRVHVMARDALQLFFALPRAGGDLASVIGKYTTDPTYRKLVWDSALTEGAIQLTMPHRVSPGALGGELEQASVGMAPENMSQRMRILGAVKAQVRDWVPDYLKGSSESILKPLYLYGKQQELMRALVYRAGFEKTERALTSFRGAGVQADLDKLMSESGAKTFDPAWQEEFKRLVASGDDDKAQGFLGRQLADATQFKYGASENPTVGRSLTGKLFMQFGSFQTQYIQYLRESVSNDAANAVKTAAVFGTVTAGLEAAQQMTGWRFRLMNPFAIGFAGGPAISMGIGALQGAGAVAGAVFDPDKPGLDRALNAGGQALGTLGSMLNPVSGLYNTATGLGSALNDSPTPGMAVGRLMLTGERGALPDILATVHSSDLVPMPNAIRQGQYQLPQVLQMQAVYPAGIPVGNASGVQQAPQEIPRAGGAAYSYRPYPDASQPIAGRSADAVKAALASQNFTGFSAEDAQFLQGLRGVPIEAALEMYRGYARDRVAKTGPPNDSLPNGQMPFAGAGVMF